MRQNLFYLIVFLFMISCDHKFNEDYELNNLPSEEISYILSEDEALNVLTNFIENLPVNGTRSSTGTFKIKNSYKKNALDYANSETITTRSNTNHSIDIQSIPIYEFITDSDEGEGFGLVVGDKRFNEVIAFSPQGYLSDTIFNEGLAAYLSTIPALVYDILDNGKSQEKQSTRTDYWQPETDGAYITDWDEPTLVFSGPRDEASALWNGHRGLWDDYEIVTPHVPVTWSQLSPYNNKIPQMCDGKRAKAGCGAVAIAQIMAYHKHPDDYDWSIITSSKTVSDGIFGSTPKVNTVSRLMRDVATATNTRYECKYDGMGGSSGSTSVSSYVPALNSMGYSANYLYSFRDKVVGSMVRDCLVDYGPALMAADKHSLNGIQKTSGHAWVVDGYYRKSRNYYQFSYWSNSATEHFGEIVSFRQHFVTIHCNWGWAGSSDGWYYIFQPVNEGYKFASYHLWSVKPNK